MEIANTVLNQDLKRLFKLCKREIFNKILNHKGRNPFPDGKYPCRNYETNLKKTLRHFREYIIKDMLLNSSIKGPYTKVISEGHAHVQLNVHFSDLMVAIKTKKELQFRYMRIQRCYYCALKCIEIYRKSGHDDFTILCPPGYREIMVNTFTRFGLNRKCVEVTEKVDRPVLVVVTEPTEEIEVDV